jgi:D-lactate dehydrogenase
MPKERMRFWSFPLMIYLEGAGTITQSRHQIHCFAICRLDRIDLHKAAAYGVKVANVPKYAPHSIAEMALLHMLSLNRKIFSSVAQHQDFNFQVDELVGSSLHKKTVGVIGTGHIGEVMIHMLIGMGCQILANDLIPKLSSRRYRACNM